LTRIDTLLDPDACPVEQHDDQPHRAGELLQDRGYFFPAEDDGQPLRRSRPYDRGDRADLDGEYGLVEKQHGAERLVLRGGTDLSLDRELREKRRNVQGTQGRGVLLPVEHDVPTNPVDVRLFRPRAVMPRPNRLPHLIEKLWA
jgi:hypothetical protein